VIGRGKHNDIYLYEVTKQDLLFNEGVAKTYRTGNVLMFADKRGVDLGRELACAEDLAAAKEYLTRKESQDDPAQDEYQIKLAALMSRLASQDETLGSLTEKIEQRDELLRDLSESLTAQKRDNSLLHEQLEQARTQLAVDEISRNEMVDDLQHVSTEIHTIESTLERVLDEKFRLEQELAERITELVELNLQNDDLKKQLVGPGQMTARSSVADATAAVPSPVPVPTPVTAPVPASMGEPSATGAAGTFGNFPDDTDPKVLTMASGKKIHVLHEFPKAPKQGPVAGFGQMLASVARVAAITLFALLVLGTASVITTAQVNGLSYGAALDLIMRSLNLS
jgi:hypothetical protein